MKPPRFPPENWRHDRPLAYYLPLGETGAECAIVEAFYEASVYPYLSEVLEANRRLLSPDPTSEANWEWVRATQDREMDHWRSAL